MATVGGKRANLEHDGGFLRAERPALCQLHGAVVAAQGHRRVIAVHCGSEPTANAFGIEYSPSRSQAKRIGRLTDGVVSGVIVMREANTVLSLGLDTPAAEIHHPLHNQQDPDGGVQDLGC